MSHVDGSGLCHARMAGLKGTEAGFTGGLDRNRKPACEKTWAIRDPCATVAHRFLLRELLVVEARWARPVCLSLLLLLMSAVQCFQSYHPILPELPSNASRAIEGTRV